MNLSYSGVYTTTSGAAFQTLVFMNWVSLLVETASSPLGLDSNVRIYLAGHNLGMGHAGVGSDPYADESDIMGYVSVSTSCFRSFDDKDTDLH